MSVQIIVDSTVDMPERMKDRFRIVPLTVHFGAEEFIDGVTIDKHRFYELLVERNELPTTSQASPAAFDAIFSDVASVGDSAVVVTLASKFSGTYQSACIAAAEYDNIYVVDSKSAAIGSGILAEYALECADKGMDAKTIAETLEKKRDEICLIALLDTLEYLKKGGRISKTVAFAGGLLNIKPVITVVDGEIQVIGKARGSKQGNNLLVQKIHESGGIDFSLVRDASRGYLDPAKFPNAREGSALDIWKTQNNQQSVNMFTVKVLSPVTDNDVKELLSDVFMVIVPEQNIEGYEHMTRTTGQGYDPNRDEANQTLFEDANAMALVNKFNPMVFTEIHGRVDAVLIEPCTPPHEPNYEYDLIAEQFIKLGEAVGVGAIANNPDHNSFEMPFRDFLRGSEDFLCHPFQGDLIGIGVE